MAESQTVKLDVTTPLCIRRAADAARSLAGAIGFSAQDCDEIALAVTELASNLVRHAGGGSLRMREVAAAGAGSGIQIESDDCGRGIPDFEQALTDGYSTTSSLGTGLGAVNRLMDRFERRSLLAGGTHLVCQRWLRPAAVREPAWLDTGVATRPRAGQKENGDAFLVHQWNGSALACVIDGIGHGPLARRAAQTARQYVEQHFDRPLAEVFRGAGRACRGTRGVVMALARLERSARTVSVGIVGDIEACVFDGQTHTRVMAHRGIVGMNAPSPAIKTLPWTPASVLIMHSDGVGAPLDWEERRNALAQSADATARHLLSHLGRFDDDATVLVAKDA